MESNGFHYCSIFISCVDKRWAGSIKFPSYAKIIMWKSSTVKIQLLSQIPLNVLLFDLGWPYLIMQSRKVACHAWPKVQTKISLHSYSTLNGNYGSVKHAKMKVRWWFKMLWNQRSTFIMKVISQSLKNRPLILMLCQEQKESGFWLYF